MKSKILLTSHPKMSFRTTVGCLHGFSVNIFWKKGLENGRYVVIHTLRNELLEKSPACRQDYFVSFY